MVLLMNNHMMRIVKAGETQHRSIGIGVDVCYYTEYWFNTPPSSFVEPTCLSVCLFETPYQSTSVCVWYKVRNVAIITHRFDTPSLVWDYLKLPSPEHPTHTITIPCNSCQRCRPSWDLRESLVGFPVTTDHKQDLQPFYVVDAYLCFKFVFSELSPVRTRRYTNTLV